jgi:hypothetical protein
MRNKIFTFLLFLSIGFNTRIFAQVTFEKGYIVKNDGNKVECLIKSFERLESPTKVIFKLNPEDHRDTQLEIEEVKEFAIYSFGTFYRYEGDLDFSSQKINTFSDHKAPDFKPVKIFVRRIVQGQANLFEYIGNELKLYFLNVENGPIYQLIYKQYTAISGPEIVENKYFIGQLRALLNSGNLSGFNFESINYNAKSISDVVFKYNGISNENIVKSTSPKFNSKPIFNLFVYIGGEATNNRIHYYYDFEKNSFFSPAYIGGMSAEYIFPFYKNKIGIISDVFYKKLNYSKSLDTYFGKQNVSENSNHLIVEVGNVFRYYLRKKYVIEQKLVLGFPVYESIKNKSSGKTEKKNISSAIGGVGARLIKNRFFVETNIKVGDRNFFYTDLNIINKFNIFYSTAIGFKIN